MRMRSRGEPARAQQRFSSLPPSSRLRLPRAPTPRRARRSGQRGRSGVLALVSAVALLTLGATSTTAAVGTTFAVDSTGGSPDASINGICADASGDCTLTAAIEEANAHAGKDTIAFAIPGAGPHVIVLPALDAGPFPFVTDAVVVDGFSQGGPGYSGPPL